MFTSVFSKTLRDQRRGLVGWGIATALTVLLMAAIWPSFADVDMSALLAQYPEAMKEAFNIAEMGTGKGYLNAELFSLMLPAMFVIFAVARGARLVAGEEEEGTFEVIASLPIARRRMLGEKALALVVSVGVLSVVLFVSTWGSALAFGLDIPVLEAFYGALAMFLLGFEFGLVALAISAGTGRRGIAVGVSAGLAGASYLLYLMAQLVDTFRSFRVLSPFYQAVSRGPLGPSFPPVAWSMAVVGILALAVSAVAFERRDLLG